MTLGSGTSLSLHLATPDELTLQQLHDILRLRVDVFVVEQACPYHEIDGHDLEPSTRHLWLADADQRVASYIRILDEGEHVRIGRVVTAGWARGRGLAQQLMAEAVDRWPGVIVLSAQSHLADMYARLGFVTDGPEFLEDGIPHVPMRRPAAVTG